MRVLVSYEGVTKILLELESFNQLKCFILQNFTNIPNKWVLQYVDAENDSVIIQSQKDLEVMLFSTKAKYIKLSIVEEEDNSNQQNLLEQLSSIRLQHPNPQTKVQRKTSSQTQTNHKYQTPIIINRDSDQTEIINNCYCSVQQINNKINTAINQKIPQIKNFIQAQLNTFHCVIKTQISNKSKISTKCKNQCPYKKGGKYLQDNNINLLITNKCFKMSKVLGGNPQEYRNFVEENYTQRTKTLLKLYVETQFLNKKLTKNTKLSDRELRRVKKLSFYYRQSQQKFIEIVKNNPDKNFYELVNLIENTPQQITKQQNTQSHNNEMKVPRLDMNKIQKMKQTQGNFTNREIGSNTGSITSKKAQFLLKCKDMFGTKRSLDYLVFFNKNNTLQQQQLIEKWIENQEQK